MWSLQWHQFIIFFFPQNTFDIAFMIAVTGELPDKEKALLEVKRVLKNNGLLAMGEILFDPDYSRSKAFLQFEQRSYLAGYFLDLDLLNPI